jgi:hypothetical protein
MIDETLIASHRLHTVLQALHINDTYLGDESAWQRCTLRCTSMCVTPTWVVQLKECIAQCRNRCLEENPPLEALNDQTMYVALIFVGIVLGLLLVTIFSRHHPQKHE